MNNETIQGILSLGAGYEVQGTFIITNKLLKPFLKKNGNFLQFNLGDKTGKVSCKVWNDADEIDKSIEDNSIVFIKANTTSYEGNTQLVVNHIQYGDPSKIIDLLERSIHDPEEMLDNLKDCVYSHLKEDGLLTALVNRFFEDKLLIKHFKLCPGGIGPVHHSYLGGLLEHTLSVCLMCSNVIEQYRDIKLEEGVLLTGALFHDIGKVLAYDFRSVPRVTTRGRLIGHLPLGIIFLHDGLKSFASSYSEKEIKKAEIDIGHLILSHHKTYEHEACRLPMTMEATILAEIDGMDANLIRLNTFLSKSKEEWTPYDPLSKRKYYKNKI